MLPLTENFKEFIWKVWNDFKTIFIRNDKIKLNSNTNSTSKKPNSKITQPSPEKGVPVPIQKKNKRKSKQKIERQPWEIGGRRISHGPRGSKPSKFERTPKLICRENRTSSIFDVILVVPENCPVNSILLNNKELSKGNQKGEYILRSYSGKLTIDRTNGKKFEIDLPKEIPLIFKLRKNWIGDGNCQKYLTKGYFVVIAPKRLARLGTAPAEDIPCSDRNFQAHFFYVDETHEETGFKGYCIPLSKYCLNLEGMVLPDKSDDGELFIQNPPILTSDSNVKWARVGYEGINAWGQNFKPNEQQVSDVLIGECGHFFIRVYDEEINLLDSDQFRFSSTLNRILVDGKLYEDDDKLIPPPKGGHKPTTLRFVDTNDKNIVPLDKNFDGTVKDDGAVFLHPVPGNDTTKWKLPSGQDYVSVVVDLQRIWWQKKLPEEESTEWLDKPIELTREEFRELAKKKTVLKFLPKRSNGSLRIGFDDKLDIKRNIRDEIALSDFLYHKPIAEPSSEESILKILIDDSKIDLILITADQFTIPPALDRILVNGKLYEEDDKLIPPPKGGHKPTTLRFVDTNGKNIVPRSDKNIDGTVKNDGVVFLQPVPSNDTTEWKLPLGQDCDSVVIELQRIWWQKKLPEDETGEWFDKPIELTRDEFRELAKKKTILEFLPKRSNKSLRIGFDDKLDIKRNIRDEIALSDFLYHKPIAEPPSEESILKILIDDSEIDLIVILADQEVDENYFPKVLGGDSRYRHGRGFSKSEVEKTGITIQDLRHLNLPLDKRRTSSHKINIEILKKVKTDA